jgi:DNA-binding SARP family transcriptional activator
MPGRAEREWHLTLLGSWALFRGDQRVRVTFRQQRLLAALALTPVRPRMVLAGMLWPESPEGHAAGNLRAALWRVTHELPGLLEFWEDTPQLSPGVQTDVTEFHACMERANSGDWEFDPQVLQLLRTAELLPGWDESWLVFEQERIRQQRLQTLQRLSARMLDRGSVRQAVECAQIAVSIAPFDETTQALLLQAHLRSGDRAAAARQFDQFRRMLNDELGVEPSPRVHRILGPSVMTESAARG